MKVMMSWRRCVLEQLEPEASSVKDLGGNPPKGAVCQTADLLFRSIRHLISTTQSSKWTEEPNIDKERRVPYPLGERWSVE